MYRLVFRIRKEDGSVVRIIEMCNVDNVKLAYEEAERIANSTGWELVAVERV